MSAKGYGKLQTSIARNDPNMKKIIEYVYYESEKIQLGLLKALTGMS